MTRRSLALAITLAGVLIIAACGGGDGGRTSTTPSTTATGADASGAEAVQALTSLLEQDQRDPSLKEGGYKKSPLVTAEFVTKVDQAALPGGGFDADPFLCTQQLPTRIDYGPARISGNRATVVAKQAYGGATNERITYDLLLVDGKWRVDGNECLR